MTMFLGESFFRPKIRAITRFTLPSITTYGNLYAIDKTAAAV